MSSSSTNLPTSLEEMSGEQLTSAAVKEGSKLNKRVAVASLLYGKMCRSSHDSLTRSVSTLLATRRELSTFLSKRSRRTTHVPRVTPHSTALTASSSSYSYPSCYGCATSFVAHLLGLLESVVKGSQESRRSLVEEGVIEELVAHDVSRGVGGGTAAAARRVVCELARGSVVGTRRACEILWGRTSGALLGKRGEGVELGDLVQDDVEVLTDVCVGVDDVGSAPEAWRMRVRLVTRLLDLAVARSEVLGPAACEQVAVPCVVVFLSMLGAKAAEDKSTLLCSCSEAVKTELLSGSVSQAKTTTEVAAMEVDAEGEVGRLERKFFDRWARRTVRRGMLQRYLERPWLLKLLLNPLSDQLRDASVALMSAMKSEPSTDKLALLDALTSLVPDALKLPGAVSSQFFGLLASLVVESELHCSYLAARGFLRTLCGLVSSEARRIESDEWRSTADITQGCAVRALVSILVSMVRVPKVRALFRSSFVEPALDAFLRLRGLVAQKTKHTDDSSRALLSLLTAAPEGEEKYHAVFMKACVSAISSAMQRGDVLSPVFALEQLCNMISPPAAPAPDVTLQLTKAPTQEEFIRGTMNKNPYSASKDIGGSGLMRDVKNKICTTLDLRGLLEDDNGMELLVNKQIVKLDLPIRGVYEQVWIPSGKGEKGSPMTVVFRLQGLDGEATEPIVETLREEEKEEKDPEEEYKIARVMAECGGVDVVVSLLSGIGQEGMEMNRDLVLLALRVLSLCAKIEVNRTRLFELNALDVALRKLQHSMSIFNRDPADRLKLSEVFESSLELAETLSSSIGSGRTPPPQDMVVDQGQVSPPPGSAAASDAQQADFLTSLHVALMSPLAKKTPKVSRGLRKLLPLLTLGRPALCERLVSLYAPPLSSLASLDAPSTDASDERLYALQSLVDVLSNTPANEVGRSLKSLFSQAGVTQSLVDSLKGHFPAAAAPSGDEWNAALSRKSTAVVLQLLGALAAGHGPTQDLFLGAGVIPLLHEIEETKATQAEGVGLLAEHLLDGVQDSERAMEEVASLRKKSRQSKLELAKKHREDVLAKMGMKQAGDKITFQASASVETLGEEPGLKCMICQEGYHFRPKDMLAVYVHTKAMPLSAITLLTPVSSGSSSSSSSSSGKMGYTTVTNFNVIHLQCHDEATKAEKKKKKQPKEEWEAAVIRNQLAKCNNLFPISGPEVTDNGYIAALERYWTHLSALKRNDLPRPILLAHDLKCLLMRFAFEQLSLPSGGVSKATSTTSLASSTSSLGGYSVGEAGGRENNIRLVPFVVQMGAFFVAAGQVGTSSTSSPKKGRAFDCGKAISEFLAASAEPSPSWAQSAEDDVLFYAALSLFVSSLEEWTAQKMKFVTRALALARSLHCSRGAQPPSDPSAINAVCRAPMMFLALVDRLQTSFKSGLAPAQPSAWAEAVKARLSQDARASSEAMLRLLKDFDESVVPMTDISEFLDDLGVLEESVRFAPTAEQLTSNLWHVVWPETSSTSTTTTTTSTTTTTTSSAK